MPIWSPGRHIPTQKIPKCPPGDRDTETTVVLSEFSCKIVFTKKKKSRIGKPSNALACVAGGLEVVGTRKNGVHPSRVSLARALISFAHYFQATNVFDKLDILGLPIREGKAFQHTERKKQANKQTILQEFCNVTGDT